MRRAKEGDWTKAVGGHYGSVFHNGRWRSFECVYCARYFGLLKSQAYYTLWSVKAWTRRPWDIPCAGASVHLAELEKRRKE